MARADQKYKSANHHQADEIIPAVHAMGGTNHDPCDPKTFKDGYPKKSDELVVAPAQSHHEHCNEDQGKPAHENGQEIRAFGGEEKIKGVLRERRQHGMREEEIHRGDAE